MEDKPLEEEFTETVEEFKKHLTPVKVGRFITKAVVRRAASAVVVTLIHTHMPKDVLDRNRKIQLYIAAWAVGGVVSDGAARWAADNVQSKIELIELVVKKIKDDETPSFSDLIKEMSTEDQPTE